METFNTLKDKMIDVLKNINKIILKHKWIIGSIIVGICLMLMIMFNISALQIAYYTFSDQPDKIANVLSVDVRNERRHTKRYFNKGVEYLLDDIEGQGNSFFETYFSYFSSELKDDILIVYNKQDIYFEDDTPIIEEIANGDITPAMKTYINRLDVDTLEIRLDHYFGKNMILSQDKITQLNNILSNYNQKILLSKFKISIYELMQFPEIENNESEVSKLIDQIEPDIVYDTLFEELKTKSIDIDVLDTWVSILDRKNIISKQDYAAFNNSYTTINQLKDEYKQLIYQEVDLINVQQRIDVQTSDYKHLIEQLEVEIIELENKLKEMGAELAILNDYTIVELYITDYYDNGTYEASIPEKSWFFNEYKPGNQKVNLQLTRTQPNQAGVYTFEVYYRGEDENNLTKYVEVSEQNKQDIQYLNSEISSLQAELEDKKEEVNKLEEEISKIHNANNYDQNNQLLQEVVNRQQGVLNRIEEQQVIIQNIFKISSVVIELEE